jgi:archaeal flagellar protein FlaJ
MPKTHELFKGVAYLIEGLYPRLRVSMRQAYMEEDTQTYLSKTVMYAVLGFVAAGALMALSAGSGSLQAPLAAVAGSSVAAFVMYYRMNLPGMIVRRRAVEMERNLAFAVQSLYIQIGSGMPVYDAMVSVAQGDYGAISGEFRQTLEEMSSGKSLSDALEDLAMRNPSAYFQRIVWQMANTIKTGGNLRDNLNDIVKSLSRDQVNMVKSYGAQLSPLTMAYMMAAVIVPSLGTTVLITFTSLPSAAAKLDKSLFWVILVVTVIMQIQFAMIIKLRRPNLIGE